MGTIIGIIGLTAFFFGSAWMLYAREEMERPIKANATDSHSIAWVIIALGFIVRCICAVCTRGHATDMGCFEGWSDLIYNEGVGNFYLSDGFHDYPPGYVYVMYVLGAVKNIFSLQNEMLWLVIKMPSIICDLAIGMFIYKAVCKIHGTKKSAILLAFFVFNPVIIFNSTIWGQVDSVLALFMLMSVYYATSKSFGRSLLWFVIAFLIKPQAIFVAPVVGLAIIDECFVKNGFNGKALKDILVKGIIALGGMFVLFMPFGNNPIDGIEVIINQYIETMGQYNYMTVNAFNLYGAFGANWTPVNGFTTVIGYGSIIAIILGTVYLYFKLKSDIKNYLLAFMLIFGIYMLSVKMHERYAFPALVFLMMAFAIKPDNKRFTVYGLISLSQFFNISWVLLVYQKNPNEFFRSPVIVIASLINLVLLGYAIMTIAKEVKGGKVSSVKAEDSRPASRTEVKRTSSERFKLSESVAKITKVDIIAIVVISLIYSCVAFYNLGDKVAPETEISVTGRNISIDLGEEVELGKIAFFTGARNVQESRNLVFWFYNSDQEHISNHTKDSASVFTWTVDNITPVKARYVVISSSSQKSEGDPSDELFIREVVFMDKWGNVVKSPRSFLEEEMVLFDEQDYLKNEKSYMAGTYFDEIYHARTAYEFLNDMSVYEWTHPPLGKVLMGIGISIFGMVPFGWRFIGTLFGVFMIAVIYLIAKRMTKSIWMSVLATLLFAFDFMHFTQTRIATIDTYVVFFIMLMYYYMYKYYKMSFYDTPLRKTLIPLGLSGIFFGLGVASKWTGIYAGAGLAIIFFITLYRRYKEFKIAKLMPKGETDGISHKDVIACFKNNTLITLGYCVIMFVIVPFIIYALSYIPYIAGPSGEGLKTVFTNAQSMMTYHGKTVIDSTHPYSSYWFEWPIMYRPVWYFSNTTAEGLKQGISAFGNPMVWWTGIVAIAYTVAVAAVSLCREKKYFRRGKNFVMICYFAVFVLLTALAGITGAANEKYTRFLPCMALYSVIFVSMFAVVLYNDEWYKKPSEDLALFISIGFFAQLLPWTLVLRTTYMYHFFTCVPFVVMAIIFVIKSLYDNCKNKRRVMVGAVVYTAVAILLFMVFYPVLSGAPVEADFVDKYLRWMESWVLV